MSNPSESKEFMLILRGGVPPQDLRPDQIQQLMSRFGEWMAQMQSCGQLKGAGRLEDDGRRLSRKQGQLVVDGSELESVIRPVGRARVGTIVRLRLLEVLHGFRKAAGESEQNAQGKAAAHQLSAVNWLIGELGDEPLAKPDRLLVALQRGRCFDAFPRQIAQVRAY